MKKYNIGVVGATGLVGRTILKLLEEYQVPIKKLKLFASNASEGKILKVFDKDFKISRLEEGCFKNLDYVLFSAGSEVSKIWAPKAVKTKAYVIDNSSCFRMDDNCALIVPEVNFSSYHGKSKIIANPNCSTIQCVVIMKIFDQLFKLKRINYTTYQSVSGSGQKGINELDRVLSNKENLFYPYDISQTVIPEIDEFLDNGYTKEEMKMVNETQKILERPDLLISATCVRVPIRRCHSVSIMCELENDFSYEQFENELVNYPNVVLLDNPKNHLYPNSLIAKDNDLIYVGRIRKDLSSPKIVHLFVTSDNIRKGAASNAVEILEKLINEQGKK